MSCYTTTASSGSIALARAITGVPEKVVGRRFHALKQEPAARQEATPTQEEWLTFLRRQHALLDSTGLTGVARYSIETRLDAAFDAAVTGSEPPPDGATFYALRHLNAETDRALQQATAPPPEVRLPGETMPPKQRASWHGLIQVAAIQPHGWTLVGGQMVAVHCWERGAIPSRPTTDGDAVLDVRANRQILHDYTAALTRLDFRSSGASPLNEHEHRWIRADGAQLDVLIPTSVGERSANQRGVTGGTTLSTPGAADALQHSRPVIVHLDDATGTIHRPHLIGAILLKGRAARNTFDTNPDRHLLDAAILVSLIRAADRGDLDQAVTQPKHRATLLRMLQDFDAKPTAWAGERDNARRGLSILRARLSGQTTPPP